MSLPKFNLDKLRKTVSRQQREMKKNIADLLLLDRLQSQFKKENKKGDGMTKKYIKGVFNLEISLVPDEGADVPDNPDANWIIQTSNYEDKRDFFEREILNSFDEYDDRKHFLGSSVLQTWYENAEDSIRYSQDGWSAKGNITLTLKESDLRKVSKHFECSLKEDKDGNITSFEYYVSNSYFDESIGIDVLFGLYFKLKEIIEIIEE